MSVSSAIQERQYISKALNRIALTPELWVPIKALLRRRGFTTGIPTEAQLVASAAHPRARALLELAIDYEANAADRALFDLLKGEGAVTPVPEIVIGSGLHASVYVANRFNADGVAPLTIDSRERLGGIFAVAKRPVFYLNSRNRPENGKPRVPGREGPLNTIVGSYIQPSDISLEEYTDQTAQAFAVRTTLATLTRSLLNTDVKTIQRRPDGSYDVRLSTRGRVIRLRTRRVILASGLGSARFTFQQNKPDSRVESFEEFLKRVGDPQNHMPLEGMTEVAVVGGNDSARVAIEALIGQGPRLGMSTAALDYERRITWYTSEEQRTKDSYETCNRSRYKGIGRDLPRADDPRYPVRIEPKCARVNAIRSLKRGVVVDDSEGDSLRFSNVIVCTGFQSRIDEVIQDDSRFPRRDYPIDTGLYRIGPVADMAVTKFERLESEALEKIPDNSASIFRYSERTAELAQTLAEAFPLNNPQLNTTLSPRFDTFSFGDLLRKIVVGKDAKNPLSYL